MLLQVSQFGCRRLSFQDHITVGKASELRDHLLMLLCVVGETQKLRRVYLVGQRLHKRYAEILIIYILAVLQRQVQEYPMNRR